mgnify:CR=1 FL=1
MSLEKLVELQQKYMKQHDILISSTSSLSDRVLSLKQAAQMLRESTYAHQIEELTKYIHHLREAALLMEKELVNYSTTRTEVAKEGNKSSGDFIRILYMIVLLIILTFVLFPSCGSPFNSLFTIIAIWYAPPPFDLHF